MGGASTKLRLALANIYALAQSRRPLQLTEEAIVRRPTRGTMAAKSSTAVIARAYTSPTLVLLAMDWVAGNKHPDFLGFAILRSPGFNPKERDAYLFNKIGFDPPGENSQPLPSNLAPFQKFLWWDAGINDRDRGKTFKYTITPVLGSGPKDLRLQHDSETTITVPLPRVEEDGIATWFNRAVVSSQAFSRQFPEPQKKLPAVMDWLANGLQNAFGEILSGAKEIDGAIYHLTDKRWVMPALKKFKGSLSLVYEDRNNDTTDRPAIKQLKSDRFKGFPRPATRIMHDKFLVDVQGDRVLMGSANFTPEGLTSQANLLHIFKSPQLAKLYDERQQLIAKNPAVAATAKGAAWSRPIKVGKATIRVFFSPEPGKQRDSIEAVIRTIEGAKSSVAFCMFDPTDPRLLRALLATSGRKKLLYGMLNSISDPSQAKQNLSDTGEPPKQPTEATKVQVELFNRSRRDKQVLAYSYFRPGDTPADFLPEFNAVDMSSQSTLPPPKPGSKKRPPPAVHIHHKFIVIDADTDNPTIYTGSANLSDNSTHHNDENLLEITGSPELARTYFAEFMRIYEHYRARALWNRDHPGGAGGKKRKAISPRGAKTFTLKKTRDEWVKGAYKPGDPAFIARTRLAK
jgi:phosphatidylserine/phosphatidylglycerophosphate/cardiolipin synthase-like enzyme